LAGFLANNRISGPGVPQNGQHRVLGLDISSRRKVASALVNTFERSSKGAPNDSRSGFNHGDGHFNVGHCLIVRLICA
jgi:hypothetical protein